MNKRIQIDNNSFCNLYRRMNLRHLRALSLEFATAAVRQVGDSWAIYGPKGG